MTCCAAITICSCATTSCSRRGRSSRRSCINSNNLKSTLCRWVFQNKLIFFFRHDNMISIFVSRYAFGSRGPAEADAMLIRNGFNYTDSYKWTQQKAKPKLWNWNPAPRTLCKTKNRFLLQCSCVLQFTQTAHSGAHSSRGRRAEIKSLTKRRINILWTVHRTIVFWQTKNPVKNKIRKKTTTTQSIHQSVELEYVLSAQQRMFGIEVYWSSSGKLCAFRESSPSSSAAASKKNQKHQQQHDAAHYYTKKHRSLHRVGTAGDWLAARVAAPDAGSDAPHRVLHTQNNTATNDQRASHEARAAEGSWLKPGGPDNDEHSDDNACDKKSNGHGQSPFLSRDDGE